MKIKEASKIVLDKILHTKIWEGNRDLHEAVSMLVTLAQDVVKWKGKLPKTYNYDISYWSKDPEKNEEFLQEVIDDCASACASLEQENRELKKALKSSEQYREAYRKSKLKLYSMGGEIAKAVMGCMPCSEGFLEDLSIELLKDRCDWVEGKHYRELQAKIKALEEELKRYKRERLEKL